MEVQRADIAVYVAPWRVSNSILHVRVSFSSIIILAFELLLDNNKILSQHNKISFYWLFLLVSGIIGTLLIWQFLKIILLFDGRRKAHPILRRMQ